MSSALSIRVFKSVACCSQQLFKRNFHSSLRRQEQFINADPQTFEKVILNKDKVILVDFYADWCNPCKMLSPILEKIAEDPEVRTGTGKPVDLVTVDTDAQVELAQKYKIRSLPTVVAFKDGQPANQFIGALPEAQVRAFLNNV